MPVRLSRKVPFFRSDRQVERFDVRQNGVEVKWQKGEPLKGRHVHGLRNRVTDFSVDSRRRLTRAYFFGRIRYTFTLTYHHTWPSDGHTSKRVHLHRWLALLRRVSPGVRYLWVLEWQARGAPHYHVYLDRTVSDVDELTLGSAWSEITSPGDDVALKFNVGHGIGQPWEAKVGLNYAAKYASKWEQKGLPEGYETYGRWWATSKNWICEPDEQIASEVDQEGEVHGDDIQAFRQVRRYLEHVLGFRFYSRAYLRPNHLQDVSRILRFYGLAARPPG